MATHAFVWKSAVKAFLSRILLVLFPFLLLFLPFFTKHKRIFKGIHWFPRRAQYSIPRGQARMRARVYISVGESALRRWRFWTRVKAWQEGPSTKFSTEETCASLKENTRDTGVSRVPLFSHHSSAYSSHSFPLRHIHILFPRTFVAELYQGSKTALEKTSLRRENSARWRIVRYPDGELL